MNQDIILKAIEVFATRAHEGQLRKYTEEPYINHPIAVAKIVEEKGGSFEMIAAALLHDVLEDTHVSIEGLRQFLFEIVPSSAGKILQLVIELTDVYEKKNFPHLNRKQRKQLEAERLGRVSDAAKQIKVADIIDNTKSIQEHDPKFAKVFLDEKEVLLKEMGF